MNLLDAQKLALCEMSKWGIINEGWTFGWNTRRSRSLGVCRYGPKELRLNTHFVDLNGEATVMDTIRHEIAHALAGRGTGHGPAWKKAAVMVGAVPRACKRAGEAVLLPNPPKWQARCLDCGKMISRNRLPRRSRYRMTHKGCRSYLEWHQVNQGAKQ